jgi:hypothetical protein
LDPQKILHIEDYKYFWGKRISESECIRLLKNCPKYKELFKEEPHGVKKVLRGYFSGEELSYTSSLA